MSQSTVLSLATSATTHKPRNLTRQPLKSKQLVHQCMVIPKVLLSLPNFANPSVRARVVTLSSPP
ncbi:hypothetical protein NW757_011103 [Fusarium falciforme]|nr:hypothetical protein NW757_011103 [Fusarium falciforme]